jgi:hypothetical protein
MRRALRRLYELPGASPEEVQLMSHARILKRIRVAFIRPVRSQSTARCEVTQTLRDYQERAVDANEGR